MSDRADAEKSRRLEDAENIVLQVVADLARYDKVTSETHEILDAWIRARRAWAVRNEE